MKFYFIIVIISTLTLTVFGLLAFSQEAHADEIPMNVSDFRCVVTERSIGGQVRAIAVRGTVYRTDNNAGVGGVTVTLRAFNVTRSEVTASNGKFNEDDDVPVAWANDEIEIWLTKVGFKDVAPASLFCNLRKCDEDPDGCPSVGGIGEQPDINEFPLETDEPSSRSSFIPYTAAVAAGVIIIITIGTWYIKRRRL